jgi:Zn-dependent peptidase ImmA (M78 family)/transcriptional regulator with XRE-family HTH domain
MATQYAHINPNNISWARRRAKLDIHVLAKKLNISEDKLLAWESGKKKITFKQAQKIADKLLIPFGYLFLQHLHEKALPIPDLRTLDNQSINEPSAELLKIIQIVQEQQDWYKNYLLTQGVEENIFFKKFSVDDGTNEIVTDMRDVLSVTVSRRTGSWEDFFRLLVKKIESIGVMVVRQGNLGHHSKSLSVDEFRGFAIFDSIAPVIFINQADVPKARLFTLIHELAHIWIGKSGVSDISIQTNEKIEVLCNAVAAEFLAPSNEFLELWREYDNWEDNLIELQSYFHVSDWVLVRRALTLGLIVNHEYNRYVTKLKKDYLNRPKQDGGPSYYSTKKSQLSENFAQAIVSEALSGRVLLRDAGHILGMKPNNISVFAKELGV